MTENNRNMILAIVLSVIVLFGWQFLVAQPQLERAQRQAEIAAQQAAQTNTGVSVPNATPGQTGTSATDTAVTPAETTGNQKFADRASALAATTRVPNETGELKGSINLRGARIDDLQLTEYKETIDPNSPIITLLTPSGAPGGYYVEQGWVPANGSTNNVPTKDTVWTLQSGTTLPAAPPVTLSWDNGAGLVFRRTIAVDDHYLFTVTQTIENKSAGDVMLFPYSVVVREGIPHVSNFLIQH
jgi:YidC/Oxa1 family membrane protein insertase